MYVKKHSHWSNDYLYFNTSEEIFLQPTSLKLQIKWRKKTNYIITVFILHTLLTQGS